MISKLIAILFAVLTIFFILNISSLFAEKSSNSLTVQKINKLLEEQTINLRFKEIIPGGEQKSYRGVLLTGFALSTTEVNQRDYMLLVNSEEEAPLAGDVSWWDSFIRKVKRQGIKKLLHYGYGDNFPVYGVSKYNSILFCNRLSEICGLERVYAEDWKPDLKKNGFRLPTEMQWEFAAGGPSHTLYSLGNTFQKEKYVFKTDRVQLVTSGEANGFGLFHMCGNVREWCQDLYNYSAPGIFPQVGAVDPEGNQDGTQSVVRGGCFLDTEPEKLACTYRMFSYSSAPDFKMGFRVCFKTK